MKQVWDRKWQLPLNEQKPKPTWFRWQTLWRYAMVETCLVLWVLGDLHRGSILWQPTYDFLFPCTHRTWRCSGALTLRVSWLNWESSVFGLYPSFWWLQTLTFSSFELWKWLNTCLWPLLRKYDICSFWIFIMNH